jgi:hypothetical protein
MFFLLFSPSFSPGAAIPSAFTCDGGDFSPPLEWSGAPPNTASFVVLVEDTEAPGGAFRHWAAYDIGAGNSGLPGGYHGGQPATFREAKNDLGKFGYSGPCPPPGSGTHHYRFTVLALRQRSVGLAAPSDVAAVLEAAQPYVIARAELTGTYQR